MKYLVAGRLYTDYQPAVEYANLIAKISRIIVAVEAVTDDFPDGDSVPLASYIPPASPK